MRKELSTFKAIIVGDVSVGFFDKTPIKKTRGDTTEMAHN